MDIKGIFAGLLKGIFGSVKTAVLLPTMIAIAVFVFLLNQGIIESEEINTGHRFMDEMRLVDGYYARAQQRSIERLSTFLEFIRQDETLQQGVRAQDRELLYRHFEPLYQQLEENYSITHLFFNNMERKNILRMHNPRIYGDSIDRIPMMLAEKTGKPSSGLEMNPAGQITMRVAAPISDKVGVAGFVEIGEEFDKVLRGLKAVTGMESVLVLNKHLLEKELFEAEMEQQGLEANWNFMSALVVSRQSLQLSPNAINHILQVRQAGTFADIKTGSNRYYGSSILLEDVAGNKIGFLLILRNLNDYTSEAQVTAIYKSMLLVAVGIMLLMVLFIALRRVDHKFEEADQRMEQAKEEMREHEKQCELIHEQNLQELEKEKQDYMRQLDEEHQKLEKIEVALANKERDLNLAATVFENSSEGLMITDRENKIIRINKTFTEITGYQEEEVIGQTPGILASGRHGPEFYKEMWASIIEHGNWQGEIWNCRQSGEIFPEWLSISVIRDEDRKPMYYLGLFSDLSEKKMSEARNQHLFNFDTLTELPNRNMLEDGLKQEIKEAARDKTVLALLHLNIDRFKTVIDTLGHPFGDKLLKAVAQRLESVVRDSDLLARFTGDEFAVILSDVGNEKNASMVAHKIMDAVSAPYELDDQEVFVTASIGISMYPANADNSDDLIRSANIASRYAREEGGNEYHFYKDEMNAAAEQRISIESSLRRALDNDEFVLYYQPQVDLRSGEIVGMEALLRWQHPSRGMVFPDEFISVLEDTGLIVPVGEWVLQTACRQSVSWLQSGLAPMRVAVNLSARQFRQNDLVKTVQDVMADTGIQSAMLELEITETVLLQDVPATITVLNRINELGLSVAIDDFGTGYSSLSYLKQLPISKIKIDRSFVKDIGTAYDDGSIAQAILNLGHNLKMKVVAEGVENMEQLGYLHEHACDEMQGYYFSRPLPAEAFEQLLRDNVNLDNM